VLLTIPSVAQTEGGQEAAIHLTDVRFDASQNVYRFDLFYTSHEAIGMVQTTLWNEHNVAIMRDAFTRPGPTQTISADASKLVNGQTYRVEVLAFAPNGTPLVTEQGQPVSVEREFVHAPNETGVWIGNPLFALDWETDTLTITLDTAAEQEIAAYRVILKENESNVVVLDEQADGANGPALSVPLRQIAEGEYRVVVQARNAAGDQLSSVQDVFVYQRPAPTLGQPLFRFEHDGPTLLVELEPQNSERMWNYRVRLVDPASNEVLLTHYEETENTPPIEVPLAGLEGGEYQVVVEALGNGNQVLDSVTSQTIYEPPPPPTFVQRTWGGMSAKRWIPVSIGAIGLLLVGGLVMLGFLRRRQTATPVLQREMRDHRGRDVSPSHALKGTEGQARKTQPPRSPDPPRLRITIEATPESRLVGEQIELSAYPFTIGRGDCSLDLHTDDSVSRRHAEIRYSSRGLTIVDTLSSNGTFVDGERIAAETPVLLDPSQKTRIRLGARTQLLLEPSK
jgi:hypothetical protein